MILNNIPILFNSFSKRKPFIDVCMHYYKRYLPEASIYLTIDNEIDLDYKINLLTYDNIPTTSEYTYKCHSRYYRHYYTLHYLKSIGYTYVMNCMDDGWITSVDFEKLNRSIDYIINNKADRIDLTGPQIEYDCLYLDDYVSIVNPNNDLQWYLTNQCSIWKIDSLLKIYDILGPVADWEVEKIGSDVSRYIGCKFLTFNTPVIDNLGLFQRTVGLYDKGKFLLEKYCIENNMNYEIKLKQFNSFL